MSAARDNFIHRAAALGLDLATARKLLRHAATLQRLAEAQCNGDWPADNGDRPGKECPICGQCWAKSSFARKLCPDCRTEDLVKRLLTGSPVEPVFQGDPRGYCLRLVPAGTSIADIDSGRVRGEAVPA